MWGLLCLQEVGGRLATWGGGGGGGGGGEVAAVNVVVKCLSIRNVHWSIVEIIGRLRQLPSFFSLCTKRVSVVPFFRRDYLGFLTKRSDMTRTVMAVIVIM